MQSVQGFAWSILVNFAIALCFGEEMPLESVVVGNVLI